jgi:hypothetical protein
MTRTLIAPALAALAALTALTAVPVAAEGLDTRAASQRHCLSAAQAAGLQVAGIARPVPVMGRLGEVLGERVRLQMADGRVLICTYDIHEMQAHLPRL